MRLLHTLIRDAAERNPDAIAIRYRGADTSYASLNKQIASISGGLIDDGLRHGERVAVYLPKQPEAVLSYFATTLAGGVFVPVNPQLKPAQVGHILSDSSATILVTTAARAVTLATELEKCPALKTIVLCDGDAAPETTRIRYISWQQLLDAGDRTGLCKDTDLAALLYTSGSTGKPKGVMLSHRNLVLGADSVCQYLGNNADDKLLTVLPFSFDYGFSQLSTAFNVGATVVLFEYLLARDVIRAVTTECISGLAAVPPVWLQLARLPWPQSTTNHLRYITNSGGVMPQTALSGLRKQLPHTKVFLMYGLTEAFRSTYLDPGQIEIRPTSIGKAVPNSEVLVIRADGSPCAANEPGELVHCGPLVSMGYWNDPEKTAARFRPSPIQDASDPTPRIAVWSGDTVHSDEEGYLYFVERFDEMIKTSGYRVSPTEVEEVLYSSNRVSVAVVIAVPHPELGQAIVVVAVPASGDGDTDGLISHCRTQMANYMIPAQIVWRTELPRNANGKIDRPALKNEYRNLFAGTAA